MLTAKNILAGKQVYDVWHVNQDAEYHEAGDRGGQETDTGGRLVPRRVGAGLERAGGRHRAGGGPLVGHPARG